MHVLRQDSRGSHRLWLIAALAGLLHLTPANRASAQPPTPGMGGVQPMSMDWGMGPRGVRSADAHFIMMMIPHHEGAIAMADHALQRSGRAQIRALAERIKTSQTEENATMRRWYGQWFGGPVPLWPARSQGMGMGMDVSLQGLRDATDFDRAFLLQMIAHHRMGVMMASHAQWGTVHPELRELEAAMVRIQSQEIDQMEKWYQEWFGSGAP